MAETSNETSEPRDLVLTKDGLRWVFRYRPGDELSAVSCLAAMAEDPRKDFDWFDAAVLSRQMGEHMHEQLRKMMGT